MTQFILRLNIKVSSTSFIDRILDPESSYHICSNMQWPSSYITLSSGDVLMGDDFACHSDEIGSIWVKIYDEMIRVHVLNLKKNLLFP